MEEDLHKTVNIQSFTYQNHLLAASRDSKIYLATTSQNKNLRPLVFKGYPEVVLNDPIKQKKFIQEVKFLWELSQKQNILQILSQNYRDRMVFIVTEYCQGGNLAHAIKNYGPFSEEKSIGYIKQIINGYRSINMASIIHRNLQPSNILINGLELKIGDFSDSIQRKDALITSKREEIVGHLAFQAPEVLEKYSYSQKSDVYSIGLIFLSMLKGSSLLNGLSKRQIVQQMKIFNIQEMFGQSLSNKSKGFLQKTLNYDVQERMQVQQMLNYSFYEIPQLPFSKFSNFEDETPAKSFSKIEIASPKHQPSSKIVKLLEIINDSVPQKSKRKTSATSIRLRISQELDFTKFQNQNQKDISIFIPSKKQFDAAKRFSKKNQVGKKPIVDNVEFEPSIMVIPSEKDHSTSSKKSFKFYAKDDVIIQEKPQQYNQSNEIIETKPKKNRNHQFTASTLNSQRKRMKENTLKTPSSRITSSKKGSSIKVFVHSPVKEQAHYKQSQTTIKLNLNSQSLDIGLLLSQIDMARFLSRTLYYVQKFKEIETQKLQETLQGLRLKIFNQIRQLTLVDQRLAEPFKKSAQYPQILEIVSIYESKCTKPAIFYSYQEANQLLLVVIQEAFQKIKGSTKMSQVKIKALDYLITCWELINLLKKRNLQVFQRQSNIEQIINDKKEEVYRCSFLEVYERMLALQLIDQS